MLKITKYQNAHEFLKDSWELKRAKNPAFSLRSWAKQLGMASHAPLNLMINGKRTIAKKHIPALIKSLALTPKDGLYLETLIEFNQSKTSVEKDLYFSRLRELVPRDPVQLFEMENFKYLGDPLHCTILDMTDLADFSSDPKWIQGRLVKKRSLKQIEEVIERLLHLGLLKRDSKQDLKKTHRHLTNLPDVADLGSQEYHKNLSLLAAEMVTEQAVTVREYNGYSMSIKRNQILRAKEMIREFSKKFMTEIEVTEGDGEETYQLNVQFFSHTHTKGEQK